MPAKREANGLRRLRERKLMTQADLASAIGARQASVSLWEQGKDRPNNASKVKLCEALGVTIEELLEALDSNGWAGEVASDGA